MSVDAMAHLDDPRIVDADAMVRRAYAAGIRHIINAGVDPTLKRPWPAIAPSSVRIHRAVGLHPMFIDEARLGEQLTAVEDSADAAVAIGEIGLDSREGAPRWELQLKACRVQLGIARESKRAVILHCVRAWDPLLGLLSETSVRGIAHGFGGPVQVLPRLEQLGIIPSFGGAVSYSKRRRAHEAVRLATRFCLESDAPDHPPLGMTDSEPAAIVTTAQTVAELQERSIGEVLADSAACAKEVFRLPTAPNDA
ncbi:MAG: TatD family hydrolase [Myxococcota bacterium]